MIKLTLIVTKTEIPCLTTSCSLSQFNLGYNKLIYKPVIEVKITTKKGMRIINGK